MRREAIGVALAVLCAIGSLALLHDRTVVAAALWLLAYGIVVARMVHSAVRQRSVSKRLGTYITVRSILAFGLAAPLVGAPLATMWPAWLALLAVIAITRGESRLASLVRRHGVRVANMVALHTPDVWFGPARVMIVCQVLTLPTLVLLGLLGVPAGYWLIAIAPVGVASIVTVTAALLRWASIRHARQVLQPALEVYAPRFAVYWDAPAGSGYQLAMWMPYLHRIGERFVILVRNPATFRAAVAVADGAPVVLARTMRDVERCVVPSLRAAFYVNNAARNGHLVRYAHLTHVQLLHGDSDKASSHNPVTAMFDKVFVAGQAAIDRYADHGITIPHHRFEIVGRPQVEGIEAWRHLREVGRPPVVLYAPTWRGQHADASYSSLPEGPALVEMLLGRGCAVLFRPHPYSRRDPEHRELIRRIDQLLATDTGPARAAHQFGPQVSELSLADCFNAADAMVSDVSGVVVDFLQSEKPLAITCGDHEPTTFVSVFPVAGAAYLLTDAPESWASAFDAMLGDDPLAGRRAQMRRHYLGDLPRDGYAGVFVAAARDVLRADPGTVDELPSTAATDDLGPTVPEEEADELAGDKTHDDANDEVGRQVTAPGDRWWRTVPSGMISATAGGTS